MSKTNGKHVLAFIMLPCVHGQEYDDFTDEYGHGDGNTRMTWLQHTSPFMDRGILCSIRACIIESLLHCLPWCEKTET